MLFVRAALALGLCIGLTNPAWAQALRLDPKPTECQPVPVLSASFSKHGRTTWEDNRIKAFNAMPRVLYETPQGWIPVGALRIEGSCVEFPAGQTGVFVRNGGFATKPISVPGVYFPMRVWYRADMPAAEVEQFEGMIRRTLMYASSLFPLGVPNYMFGQESNIFITTGIIGEPGDDENPLPQNRLQLNPGRNLQVVWRAADDIRTEELYIHMVTHTFNRYRGMPTHHPATPEIRVSEFEELVASWAEVRFISDDQARLHRIARLYNGHEALFQAPLERLRPGSMLHMIKSLPEYSLSITLPTGRRLTVAEVEYIHYTLPPLMLTALDGLMKKRGIETGGVTELLVRIHIGQFSDFYEALKDVLGPEDVDTVRSWAEGKVMIPEELVLIGLTRYMKPEFKMPEKLPRLTQPVAGSNAYSAYIVSQTKAQLENESTKVSWPTTKTWAVSATGPSPTVPVSP